MNTSILQIENPEELVDPYADMPPLLCGVCEKALTTGGYLYELETPTTTFCHCCGQSEG